MKYATLNSNKKKVVIVCIIMYAVHYAREIIISNVFFVFVSNELCIKTKLINSITKQINCVCVTNGEKKMLNNCSLCNRVQCTALNQRTKNKLELLLSNEKNKI